MALTAGSYELDHAQIPGLWQPLKRDHFTQICETHNKLPTDDVLLKVEEEVKKHVPQLEALFKRWKVDGFFALNVLHRHCKLPDGYNQVGRTIKKQLYFTREVANNALNSSEMYGSKFVLTPRGWSPVEIHEGSMPGLSRVDPEFFSCFTTHLVNHGLTSIFGFEYIVPELSKSNTLELPLSGYGLVVVNAATVPFIGASSTTTRWTWSPETELKCIQVPGGDKHIRMPVKPQQSDPSDDQVIAAFEKEYHDAY